MNADTGEMRDMPDLRKALLEPSDRKNLQDIASKIEALQKEGFTTPFQVGEEVEINGCRFRIEYIRSGKEPIMTVVGLPKFQPTNTERG